MLAVSMMNIGGDLNAIKVNMLVFELRLDHLLHFLVYFMICMYFMAGQWKGLILFTNRQLLKFIVAILILATVTEVVQLWVPARTCSLLDWLSNVTGILLGLLIIRIIGSRLKI